MRENCGGVRGRVTPESKYMVESLQKEYVLVEAQRESLREKRYYRPVDVKSDNPTELDTALRQIFYFLLNHYGQDFSLTDIAQGVDLPRLFVSNTILTPGYGDMIIKKTRQVGNTSFYGLKASRTTWGELERNKEQSLRRSGSGLARSRPLSLTDIANFRATRDEKVGRVECFSGWVFKGL